MSGKSVSVKQFNPENRWESCVRVEGVGRRWRGLWEGVHNTGSSSTYQAGCRGRFFRRFDRRRGRIVPLPKCHGVLQDQTALHLLRRRRKSGTTRPPADRHRTHEQTGEDRNKREERKRKQKAACTWSLKKERQKAWTETNRNTVTEQKQKQISLYETCSYCITLENRGGGGEVMGWLWRGFSTSFRSLSRLRCSVCCLWRSFLRWAVAVLWDHLQSEQSGIRPALKRFECPFK